MNDSLSMQELSTITEISYDLFGFRFWQPSLLFDHRIKHSITTHLQNQVHIFSISKEPIEFSNIGMTQEGLNL